MIVDGKPDDRFQLTASEKRISVHLLLGSGFHGENTRTAWASETKFNEYLDFVYRGVDQFLADVPDAQVYCVDLSITYDSQIWQEIKPRLIAALKNRKGYAVGFPPQANGVFIHNYRTSPVMKKITDQLEKKVKRPYDEAPMFLAEGAHMNRDKPEDFQRKWKDIVKLPDLALNMSSISVSLGFGPLP